MDMSETRPLAPRPRPFQRRTFLVDRAFQLRAARRLALAGGLPLVLLGVLAERVGARAAAPGWLLLGAFALGVALVLAGVGLWLSHRVAGPVHVMTLSLAALAAGRYPRLRPLRRRDELQAFFARFAETVERIRAREAEEAELLARAHAALQPLGTTPAAREALAALAALHHRKRQAAAPDAAA